MLLWGFMDVVERFVQGLLIDSNKSSSSLKVQFASNGFSGIFWWNC